jgi:hypothetical protein
VPALVLSGIARFTYGILRIKNWKKQDKGLVKNGKETEKIGPLLWKN